MRGKRIIGLLVLSTSLLVMPALEVPAAPPASAAELETVQLEQQGPGRYVGTVPSADVVSVAAMLDGRRLELRWQDGNRWSPWRGVAASGEHAPDPDSVEAATARSDISEPMWIGETSALEVRADGPGPVTLELVRMTGGLGYDAAAPTVTDSAEALAIWPPIIPRYRWDPRGDCQPTSAPRTADTARRIYIHHTVIFPHYDRDEADDVVRATCLGHVNRRGFADVGYNFLIDVYGNIYQGRAGGILQPVIGAHASGFNRGSIGIAIIGDFDAHRVPAEAVSALDRLVAWLSDLHGIEPFEVSGHVSTGGETTRFAEGEVVELPAIVGHRDTALNSACPGDHLYEYVRGGHPMAPRVRQILESAYGWSGTPLSPPPPGEPQIVAPSAGHDHDHDEPEQSASLGDVVRELGEVVRAPDPAQAVRGLVRGATVASELVAPQEQPAP
ncbi:MAG: N-acetylmuramoyl-L-alanine amidase [Nitriliruptorales bacterium]|nr:N-acetylmuramoyl-L-alanine amidase [Nitriliruptorales bacterium]